jgi:Do/DeqQ family serine protease
MPRHLFAGALLLISTHLFAALPTAVDGQPLPSLAPMLERTIPGVVNISTSSRRQLQRHPLLDDPFFSWFFQQPRQRTERKHQSLGSGVIVDAQQGYVLTNQHVIDGADEIRVTLQDGRDFSATLLGQDPEMDIAVLQIPADNLSALKLGDSQALKVGDFVVAIGSPFGLNQTVTSGIVSALGRSGLGIEGYESFIQTDASINPGNSGGPLVNLRGELIGINTAILAPGGGNVGIGFAIPANIVRSIMRQIVEYGGVERGIFGISAQTLSAELAEAMGLPAGTRGAMLNEVEPGSSAASAGLQAGDVILRVNDQVVRSANELHTQLGLVRIGEQFGLTIQRNGRQRLLRARIEDPYAGYVRGSQVAGRLEGAYLKEVNDRSHLGQNRGIAVGRVTRDSTAWRLGLREKDVIFELNRERVTSLAELAELTRERIWQIRLRRGESLVTLVSR